MYMYFSINSLYFFIDIFLNITYSSHIYIFFFLCIFWLPSNEILRDLWVSILFLNYEIYYTKYKTHYLKRLINGELLE